MENKEKEFLPLGSIVKINDSDRKFMITGYLPIVTKDNTIYDYCACFYPEGYLSEISKSLFNKSDIKEVLFVGFKDDDEYKELMPKIEDIAEEIYKRIGENELPFKKI